LKLDFHHSWSVLAGNMVNHAETNARGPSNPLNVHRPLLSAAKQLRENYFQFGAIKTGPARIVSRR